MSRPLLCGPFVCAFPCPHCARQASTKRFPTWRCPYCGTTYVLSRPKPRRPWRPHPDAAAGYWRLPLLGIFRHGATPPVAAAASTPLAEAAVRQPDPDPPMPETIP